MKNEIFIGFKRQLQDHNDVTLEHKGVEYSDADDRLWNFKVAADILTHWLQAKKNNTVSVAEVAWMFGLKHEVSIMKILADGEPVGQPVLNEKFGDKANYNVFSYADLCQQSCVKPRIVEPMIKAE